MRKERIRLEPYGRAPEWKITLPDRIIYWIYRLNRAQKSSTAVRKDDLQTTISMVKKINQYQIILMDSLNK